ncbi:helix-turn-helix transcriptional regulator [Staphylococcus haemolyticus]|uniref:helix-turn-helix domain-containing protein n=1 Tax=Staphylococcus haemolyticus TaxID=1283 RepID=UPI00290517FF|nr:helix-turn-helix transcriptional regulator [Staphylococcus haemolyticus]MDU0434834.1 helix-turn-helix transcriptional regulator [Staphylococcus haemolyticus]MDU0440176.1 helix-turn-helix transcriptional regulator [Staphylococcus haemolyticus]
MDIDKTEVGKRIKNIRLNQSKNLREFGELISKNLNEEKPVSDSIVSRWEKGISIPSAKRLKEIANIGNVSTNYLLYSIEFSYEDIEKNIKSEEMKHIIEEALINLLRNELSLLNSRYNTYFAKTLELLGFLLEEQDLSFEELIKQMYTTVSNNNFDFYTDAIFVMLNENHKDLTVKLYLTEFIYFLLVQISLNYPNVYFKNLHIQLENIKYEIEGISKKNYLFRDYGLEAELPNFINKKEYSKLLTDIEDIKKNLDRKKLLKDQND